MEYDADFVIIGSGFGGSVAALRLAEKGYSISANLDVNPSLTITALAERCMSLIPSKQQSEGHPS